MQSDSLEPKDAGIACSPQFLALVLYLKIHIRRGLLDDRLPVVSGDVPVKLIVIIEEEDGIFDPVGNHIRLASIDKPVCIADPYIELSDRLYSPYNSTSSLRHRLRRARVRCRYDLPEVVSVFERNVSINPVPRSMKRDIDRFSYDKG